MSPRLSELIDRYDSNRPLSRAETPPAAWYIDAEFAELERQRVFGRSWQFIARSDQLAAPGAYVTARIAGQPLVVLRDRDGALRGFYNVCRHHAAEILPEESGRCEKLRCPYHGWTYGLDGALVAAPEFGGVDGFDAAAHGLVPVEVAAWGPFVFVRLAPGGPSLVEHLGRMGEHVDSLGIGALRFHSRRVWDIACNWKVFVDNYLDGGYHVPHIHKGLGSVLDYREYKIENGPTWCLQSSPMRSGGDPQTAAVRGGETAYYYWLHPNFMLNWYEGYLDINVVLPLAVDRCRVIFDFYFAADTPEAQAAQQQSIRVAERIQQEDIDVCESVQRGLASQAYDTGRLSVRREAGEHLFHRLLHADLSRP